MNPKERRGYGTGSLVVYTGANGKQTWYGRWYVGKKRVKRRIGPKRKPGGRKGLTRTQAEAELRRLMVAERAPLRGSEVSVTEAAEHMLRHLEARVSLEVSSASRDPVCRASEPGPTRAQASAGPTGGTSIGRLGATSAIRLRLRCSAI